MSVSVVSSQQLASFLCCRQVTGLVGMVNLCTSRAMQATFKRGRLFCSESLSLSAMSSCRSVDAAGKCATQPKEPIQGASVLVQSKCIQSELGSLRQS
eukprot:4040594-Amphidinium_carterae.1